MFAITAGRGFQMTFANGWTVSVQWGSINYCDKRSFTGPDHIDHEVGSRYECANAEIAAWKGKRWHKFADGQDVSGYRTPEEVAIFIAAIAAKRK